jgi:rhodanese-related sulfurtransferase
MTASVDAQTLKAWLQSSSELALIDVREHGQYGESHLFYAVPLPYSRLELDIGRLVPRLSTKIVLYDDGTSNVAPRAARRLEAIGYTDVRVLAGGTGAWDAAGYQLFAGVNVPSKAFGELIEHKCGTPHVSAAELKAMSERGDNLVIVDGRPFAEFRKMSIPGALCCPNGELPLRIGRIAPDPRTTIVVNCAGRTRSIIGAQTLRYLGVPNRVVALENGTQGWFLAGFSLEHGAHRSYPGLPEGAELSRSRERARALAERHQVPFAPAAQVRAWLEEGDRTTYVFDVRTAEEYEAGSIAGAVHAPAGQLVQASDQWIAVRGARIVIADKEGVRAVSAAMWLRQMGHDAYVLTEGVDAAFAVRPGASAAGLPELAVVAATALDDACLIDLRPSMAYRASHARGAIWSIRPLIANAAAGRQRVGLIADEPMLARAAALDLFEAGVKEVFLVRPDLPAQTTPQAPPDAECIDFLFFTHGRHEGNREAAMQYLAWETNLLRQVDETELAAFRIADHVTAS